MRGLDGPSRRQALRGLLQAGAALALFERGAGLRAQTSLQVDKPLPDFTGPEPNPFWNGVGPLVVQPQKAPLIQLTDRPVQLETPRHYFLQALTPNPAFFVRWHLSQHPRAVDLSTWRLLVEGQVQRRLELSFDELVRAFRPVTVTAVNQCAGNSRSRFSPRVPGSQWGHGAMGCAQWTGVRLREVLQRAGLAASARRVQFAGLDGSSGPQDKSSARYVNALDVTSEAIEDRKSVV